MVLAAENQNAKRALPPGWRWVRLGGICELNPRRPPGLWRAVDDPTSFVPMEAVDEIRGEIMRRDLRPFRDLRKGYTYFAENDVLFAKITPCMQNGKHAIARGLLGGLGFGTTEFHVVRPGPSVAPEWIHFYVRQPSVLENAKAYFTGAVGQQRVPESYLAELEIPLPPLDEQKRIAAILNDQMAAVERARAAAQAQLAAAQALPAAYLRAVFSSPEARAWSARKLGEVGEIISGVTLGRKLNGAETTRVPYLRVANVKDGYLDLSDVYEIEATSTEIEKCALRYGDLLLTEGGDPDKLGRGTFWEAKIPRCIHQNHIFRVRFDLASISPQFMSAQFGSAYGKTYFLGHAKRTTGIATINQQVLKNFPVLLPPIAQQEHIAAMLGDQIASSERARKAIEEELDTINKLPAALLRRAFSGGT